MFAGDAYVSPLVIHNTFIIGVPIMTIANLVHKSKTEKTHKTFEIMDEALDLKCVCRVVPVITDKVA